MATINVRSPCFEPPNGRPSMVHARQMGTRTYWVDDAVDNLRVRVTLYRDAVHDSAPLLAESTRRDSQEGLLPSAAPSFRRRRSTKQDGGPSTREERGRDEAPLPPVMGTRARPFVREFAWQEKVFGPTEVRRYRSAARRMDEAQGAARSLLDAFRGAQSGMGFRDRQYAEEVVALDAQARAAGAGEAQGDILHSKVHVDNFVDRKDLTRRMTTASSERRSSMVAALLTKGHGTGEGGPPEEEAGVVTQAMHIVAELHDAGTMPSIADFEDEDGPDRDVYVLCSIRAYASGRVDVRPGFANEGVEAGASPAVPSAPLPLGGDGPESWHRLSTRTGDLWLYRVENLAEQALADKARRGERSSRLQELVGRRQLAPANYVAPPPFPGVRLQCLGEIATGRNFDGATIMVQYFVHVNTGWTVSPGSPMHGMSQACQVKAADEDGLSVPVAHFNLPFELELMSLPSGSDEVLGPETRAQGVEAARAVSLSPATVFVQVLARDMFGRYAVEGYGYASILARSGSQAQTLRTWRPAHSALASMRRIFIHQVCTPRPGAGPLRAGGRAGGRCSGRDAATRDARAGRRSRGPALSVRAQRPAQRGPQQVWLFHRGVW